MQIDHLIAADASAHSERSILTLEPLAGALNLHIDHRFADGDFGAVVSALQDDPGYAAATILVCWHHDNIVGLADALGMPVAPPPSWKDRQWPDVVYGWVAQLRYDSNGRPDPSVNKYRNGQFMYADHDL